RCRERARTDRSARLPEDRGAGVRAELAEEVPCGRRQGAGLRDGVSHSRASADHDRQARASADRGRGRGRAEEQAPEPCAARHRRDRPRRRVVRYPEETMILKLLDPGVLRGMKLDPSVLQQRLDPSVLQQRVADVALQDAAKPKLGVLGLVGLGALAVAAWMW